MWQNTDMPGGIILQLLTGVKIVTIMTMIVIILILEGDIS